MKGDAMQVQFTYLAQIRTAAGAESEQVELADGTTLDAALAQLGAAHGDAFGALTLDESGRVRPSLVALVNDVPVDRDGPCELADGDQVVLLSPVAGG
jgi:molybdopterin converting factor small subunit